MTSEPSLTPDLRCASEQFDHPSAAHKAACPVCNPDMTVPQLSAAFEALTSNLQSPLPCPFCGLAPDVIQARNAPLWWIIKCMHADCEIEPTVEREGREAAIAAWNKRSSLSEPTSAHETVTHVHCACAHSSDCPGIQLEAALPAKQPSPEWLVKARAQGRAEAVQLITAQGPESFMEECIGEHAIADTGDYDSHWNHAELSKLLQVDDNASSPIDRADAAYWGQQAEIDNLKDELKRRSGQETSPKLREVADAVECDIKITIASDTADKVEACFRAIETALDKVWVDHDVAGTMKCDTRSVEKASTDDALFCECGHSFGQHSKGPVKDLYCRHCPCPQWRPASNGTPEP